MSTFTEQYEMRRKRENLAFAAKSLSATQALLREMGRREADEERQAACFMEVGRLGHIIQVMEEAIQVMEEASA